MREFLLAHSLLRGRYLDRGIDAPGDSPGRVAQDGFHRR